MPIGSICTVPFAINIFSFPADHVWSATQCPNLKSENDSNLFFVYYNLLLQMWISCYGLYIYAW